MSQDVLIEYTNHKGETRERRITPHWIFFGSTEWHPESQWLLRATDVEKQAARYFAMKDIHSWRPVLLESQPLPCCERLESIACTVLPPRERPPFYFEDESE